MEQPIEYSKSPFLADIINCGKQSSIFRPGLTIDDIPPRTNRPIIHQTVPHNRRIDMGSHPAIN